MEGNEPLVMEFTSKEGMKKASIPTLADTGSDIDAIPDKVYYAYFREILLRPNSPTQSATGSPPSYGWVPSKQQSTGPSMSTSPAQQRQRFTC